MYDIRMAFSTNVNGAAALVDIHYKFIAVNYSVKLLCSSYGACTWMTQKLKSIGPNCELLDVHSRQQIIQNSDQHNVPVICCFALKLDFRS